MKTPKLNHTEDLDEALASDNVPEGWAVTAMNVIGQWTTGGTPSRKVTTFFDGDIHWVKSGDLNDGLITETAESISQQGLDNCAAKILPPETVVIALYGATIGKLGVLSIPAATNQACASCQVDSRLLDHRLLLYYLLSQRQALINAGQGGAQPNINNRIVRDWPLPLPPRAEQKRIVTKVEALLAEVKRVRARLERVPKILKAFRQSVLATACCGRLTEGWREKHPTVYPADGLLLQIRRGHERNGLSHGGKAASPTEDVHTLSRDDFPDTWGLEELKWLCRPGRPITYGILKPGPDRPNGIPYIRVADFPGNRLNPGTVRRTSPEIAHEYRRSALASGDVLLSIRGTAGRVCRVPMSLEGGNITQDTARISVHPQLVPEYIELYLQCPSARGRLDAAMKGVAVRGVNIGDVRALQVAVPPQAEQKEIVCRVETLFKLADTIEKQVESATRRAEKITQAILAKAFRGEFVPTEAELARRESRPYERASVLLERIKSQHKAKAADAARDTRVRRRGAPNSRVNARGVSG